MSSTWQASLMHLPLPGVLRFGRLPTFAYHKSGGRWWCSGRLLGERRHNAAASGLSVRGASLLSVLPYVRVAKRIVAALGERILSPGLHCEEIVVSKQVKPHTRSTPAVHSCSGKHRNTPMQGRGYRQRLTQGSSPGLTCLTVAPRTMLQPRPRKSCCASR